eukprot:CAMPEP_0117480612 /NCGR_PEP_ID=MMETSP0784-20121206/12479_1 /TAXON_ID=39447 /ORGANISM="" /LENGTH=520 /DNA_ID=CAMNT_0005275053 /DNA_START=1 /DNA_END=1563 /DNA_ORIENTATION=+
MFRPLDRRRFAVLVTLPLAFAGAGGSVAVLHSDAGGPIFDVFEPGIGGYSCFRIPSLLQVSGGALLAFVEGRRDSCADWADIDIVLRRSHDGGETWSDVELVVPGRWGEHNVAGNFAPVQDRHTARILLPFTRGNYELWMSVSDDGGNTWAEPWHLEGVERPEWTWIGLGPPAGLQLSSGRIVLPAHGSTSPIFDAGIFGFSLVVYSDDHGATWKTSRPVSNSVLPLLTCTFGNENQVVEVMDTGELVMNARSICGGRLQATSRDGGGTWSPFEHIGITQPLGGCEGSLIAAADHGHFLFSGPDSSSLVRVNLTVWVGDGSSDGWSKAYEVDVSGEKSGYSSLAILQNGSVGLLWERGALVSVQLLPASFAGSTPAGPALSGEHGRSRTHSQAWQMRSSHSERRDPRKSCSHAALLIFVWILFILSWGPVLRGRVWPCPARFRLLLRLALSFCLAWNALGIAVTTAFFGRDDAVRWRRQTLTIGAFCGGLLIVEGLVLLAVKRVTWCAPESPYVKMAVAA